MKWADASWAVRLHPAVLPYLYSALASNMNLRAKIGMPLDFDSAVEAPL
jgi:hypothetical protein